MSSNHLRLDRLETAVWDVLDDLDLLKLLPRVAVQDDDGEGDDAAASEEGSEEERRSGSKRGVGDEVSSRTQRILQPPLGTDISGGNPHSSRLLPDLVTTVLRELLADTGTPPSSSQSGSDSDGPEKGLPSTWEGLVAWDRSASSSLFVGLPPWVLQGRKIDVESDPAAESARNLEVVLHLLTSLQLQRLPVGGPPSNSTTREVTLDGMVRGMSPRQLELLQSHRQRLRGDYERRRRALALRRNLRRQGLGDDGGGGTSTSPPLIEEGSSSSPLSAATDAWGQRSVVDLMDRLSRPHSSAFHISTIARAAPGPHHQQQQQHGLALQGIAADDESGDRHGGAAPPLAPLHASNDSGRGRLEGEESRKKAAAWSTSAPAPAPAPARHGDGDGGGNRRNQDRHRGTSNRGKPNSHRKHE